MVTGDGREGPRKGTVGRGLRGSHLSSRPTSAAFLEKPVGFLYIFLLQRPSPPITYVSVK